MTADSNPTPPGPAATVDLDLAFSADPDLEPGLLQAGGTWLDPLQGADRWHGLLAAWLGALQAELPSQLQSPAYSLGLSLVGDAEIAALNADWRGKSGPTDVLAFAAQDDDLDGAAAFPLLPQDGSDAESWEGEPLELGDIVMSIETAARQAAEHGHTLVQELLFLASHGLLHLLGWDHPDDASLAAMLARQERLVKVPAEP
ncbi:rRNA maturation RNase YbeY [Cyanobium sp. T1B-Tous]|uniref:rRNA maturation RNase YbeY n=1 Tax=Cyanobium sp. T1B-Tous TaxID=2823721 RepID=UPI0020CB938C|nr:rRNA maturation RNase YbeY [Cyanobium sp. T1B-Tous]MCP9807438.1 rRNA maturation RNase YbeY [Cyanobium sp. T1B-Tous]